MAVILIKQEETAINGKHILNIDGVLMRLRSNIIIQIYFRLTVNTNLEKIVIELTTSEDGITVKFGNSLPLGHTAFLSQRPTQIALNRIRPVKVPTIFLDVFLVHKSPTLQ